MSSSEYPFSISPRLSKCGSTLKSGLPRLFFMVTSHKLATLNQSRFSSGSIKAIASDDNFSGSDDARSNRCVSSSKFTSAPEQVGNVVFTHPIEIFRYGELPF